MQWTMIKIPGYLWIIVIPLAVILIHTYFPDPYIWDVTLMVAGIVLRSVANNDHDANQLIDLLKQYKGVLEQTGSVKATGSGTLSVLTPAQPVTRPTAGMRSVEVPVVHQNILPDVPEKPSGFMRKLLT